MKTSSRTDGGCNACARGYAATWHDENCPRFANQCECCKGEGITYQRLSCECCTDIDTCEECNGSGNAPRNITESPHNALGCPACDSQTDDKQS